MYCLNNFNVCGFCSLTFYLSYPLFINKLACLILMIIERNITLIDIIFIFYVVTFKPLMNFLHLTCSYTFPFYHVIATTTFIFEICSTVIFSCRNTDNHIFYGENCTRSIPKTTTQDPFPVSKLTIIAISGGTGGALLLIILISSICFCYRLKQAKRNK